MSIVSKTVLGYEYISIVLTWSSVASFPHKNPIPQQFRGKEEVERWDVMREISLGYECCLKMILCVGYCLISSLKSHSTTIYRQRRRNREIMSNVMSKIVLGYEYCLDMTLYVKCRLIFSPHVLIPGTATVSVTWGSNRCLKWEVFMSLDAEMDITGHYHILSWLHGVGCWGEVLQDTPHISLHTP